MRHVHGPRPRILALLTILLLSAFAPCAYAEGGPFTKLARGFVNATTGWLEVPFQFARHAPDKEVAFSPIYGFFEGLRQAGARTLYGLWDIASFPAPPYDSPTPEPETLITPKSGPPYHVRRSPEP